jgi:hypothetical protein
MRGAKPIAMLALALALYAAATVGTASGALAREAAQVWNCEPGEAAPAGRGGPVREPDLGEVHADLPAVAKGKAGRNFRATVPVYFHVVTDGSIGNLTPGQIADQITVLNVTFGGGEGGAKTGFAFELAGVTRTDNAKWFYSGSGGAEHDMKRTLRRGGASALTCTRRPPAPTSAGPTCPRS